MAPFHLLLLLSVTICSALVPPISDKNVCDNEERIESSCTSSHKTEGFEKVRNLKSKNFMAVFKHLSFLDSLKLCCA